MLLVSEPVLGVDEKAALAAVIESGWVTMGDRVREFEQTFARLHEAEDSIAVGSCTAALHLILHALGIGPGDEVLVPSLTFVATANSVLYVGARPVFVDIESPAVPLMSLEEAEAKCTSRTKAVIIVHFGGYLAHRDAWQAFARRKGLLLIEDAAHAPGLPAAGTFGEAAAFSFYGNKNMTTAEGGAIIARSRSVRETIRQARSHGMTSSTRQRLASRRPDYDVTMLGFNYRMDELRAAVGLVQLKGLPEWNDIRRRLSLRYRQLIAQHCPIGNGAIHGSMAIGASSDASCASDRNQAADRYRSAAQARYSDHRSLSPCTSPDILQRSLPRFSFAANRGICPTGAYATSPSPDDPGLRRTRRQFSRSRTGCGASGGGNRMTMHDLADQLSGPSLGMRVGLWRALDIMCAGVAAAVLAPLMLIVVLAIWIEGGRPILFAQLRLGQYGRPFRMYKFRKFRPDCDNNGCPLTIEGDGRLTVIGRVLAVSKLDELPQLWNVLRGNMSLVGPRPESLAFSDCFRNGFEKIHEHKPGIFGPCQVMFRHESKLYPAGVPVVEFYRQVLFPAKAEIDLAYFSCRTLVSDLGWILRGVWAIAAGSRIATALGARANEIRK